LKTACKHGINFGTHEIHARRNDNQYKAYHKRMESQISSLVSRMEADRKSGQEEIRAGQEQISLPSFPS
jgi:hypothetical protein